MKAAKKKGSAKKTANEGKREEFHKEFKEKGPMRLRKYAVTGLGISADLVDEWNDFDVLIDRCVAKAMGEDISGPVEDNGDEETYSEDGEFDASGMTDDGGDGEDDDFDGEMDDSGGGMFADPDEDEGEQEKEKEVEPEPEPEKSKGKKKRTKKAKAVAPMVSENEDVSALLTGMLDVITNQGVVIDKLKDAMTAQKSTVEEIYVRQEASHRAITAIAKTVFKVSTMVNEFVPRALKAMKFKPQASKDIRAKAEASGKDAENLISGLLDPEAD